MKKMKKLSIKVITMMVVVICIVSTFAVPASAEDFNYSGWKYTCETNTVGKSIAIFSGICPDNISNSYMSLYSYCQGGPVDSFNTTFVAVIRGNDNSRYSTIVSASYSTEEDGGRTFEDSLDLMGADCPMLARGSTQHRCYNLNNLEDDWIASYTHEWDYEGGGWLEH